MPSDAPAVVMLHGTGAHWETFARNLGPYGAHFRTIAFDMVGNGFSGRPDYDYEIRQYVDHALAVMDVLGVKRAHLLGTSLGSWVAAAIALLHPERVDKLVLMSAAGLIASEENMQRIIATRMKAVEDPNWESIKAMFDHLIADERNRLPDLVSLRQAIYRQPGMVATMRHTLVLQDLETRNRNLLSEDEWRSIEHPRAHDRLGPGLQRVLQHLTPGRRADAQRASRRDARREALAALRGRRDVQPDQPRVPAGLTWRPTATSTCSWWAPDRAGWRSPTCSGCTGRPRS